jgi:hypothetical protein
VTSSDVEVALEMPTAPDLSGAVAEAHGKLPDPAELPKGQRVVVLGSRRRGLLAGLLGAKPVPPSVRATALLARGYVEIGADGDRVWGHAPRD